MIIIFMATVILLCVIILSSYGSTSSSSRTCSAPLHQRTPMMINVPVTMLLFTSAVPVVLILIVLANVLLKLIAAGQLPAHILHHLMSTNVHGLAALRPQVAPCARLPPTPGGASAPASPHRNPPRVIAAPYRGPRQGAPAASQHRQPCELIVLCLV